ncbi:MAG: protein kinase, partial [Gemmatimonadetes bacterium]|nr:protein kinase [Gemmatimonadota bacterium]
MIGQTVSHYLIEKRLGGGGMGDVYLAQDTTLASRQVAIKVVRPELLGQRGNRTRLLAEANMIARLQHPYICEIHDVGELEEGHLFLVMAHYAGGTLRDRMRRPMAPAEAVSIALAIARGIGHAHGHDIV